MTNLILVTEHKRCLQCDSIYITPAGVFIELQAAVHPAIARFRRRILTPATPENLPTYLVTHQHILEEVHTTVSACQACFLPSILQPDLLTILEPTQAEIVERQATERGAFTLSDFSAPSPTEH